MFTLKLLAGLAFCGSVAWLYAQPGYEPAIAAITSLSSLIALAITSRRARQKGEQNQEISGNSFGIQAGGDVRIGQAEKNG